MARLTRNSYKRKIILFAVFVFISIALISTGFAAWVMSNDADVNASGNVSVGVVADSSLGIEFNETEIKGFTFQFEPAEGDLTGRVRLDKETNLSEKLSLEVKGKITNPDILDSLTIQIELPEGVKDAIDANYIVAPACANGAVEVEVDPTTGEFSYVVEFKWGTHFNEMNPSLYYDMDSDGKEVPNDEVKTTLENLRAYVYGYYDDMVAVGADRATVISNHKGDNPLPFKIILVALAD